MLSLLFYYAYLAVVFFTLGFAVKMTLKIQKIELLSLYLLGIITSTFFFSFLAFLLPINHLTSILYHLICFFCLIRYRKNIANELPIYINKYKASGKVLKITMLLGLILTLWVSAMPPFLIDNESYYIQSIKWLNEYGLVKGLANLHPFLGQMSGWHILESGLNVNFYGIKTNDLNGFMWCLFIFDALKKATLKKYLYIFILFLAPIALFLVSSPSPDLPVLLCLPWLVIKLLEQDKTTNSSLGVMTPAVLAFLVMVKITTLPFLGLLFLGHDTTAQKRRAVAILTITFGIITAKNYILTAWLTYPFPWINTHEMWSLPIEFYRFENKSIEISYVSFFQNSWAALLICMMMCGAIFLMLKQKRGIIQWVFTIACIQIMIVLANGVTLRLALPGIILLLLLAWHVLKEQNWVIKNIQLGYASIIVLTISGGLVLNGKELKTNKTQIGHGGKPFETSNIVLPAAITRFENMKFSKLKIGNLEVNTPCDESFLFGTYAGETPCVSINQIKYFKEKFKKIPQKIGKSTAEGFYSADIK